MKQNYPIKIDKENMAYVAGVNLGISSKVSIELASWIRGKSVEKAKAMLERVIAMKEAVPYKRFNKDVGHKPGIGPGRYPVKASQEFLGLIKSAESNAVDKGLNPADLFILHISADRAAQQWKYGRQRRRKAKRTHVKIVLKESGKRSAPKAAEKPTEKAVQKEEIKPITEAVKTPEVKPVVKEEKKPADKPTAQPEVKPTVEKVAPVKKEEKIEQPADTPKETVKEKIPKTVTPEPSPMKKVEQPAETPKVVQKEETKKPVEAQPIKVEKEEANTSDSQDKKPESQK